MAKEPILLVVDDEEIERKMISQILQSHLGGQYRIQQAPNGLAAIEMARCEAPEIVIMDIQMPVLNGLNTLAELQKIHHGLFSVILTAHNEFEYAVAAVKLGVEDYILKPVRRKKLIEAIDRIEKKKNTRLERGQANWKQQFDFLFPYIEDNIISGIVMDTFEKKQIRKIVGQLFPGEKQLTLISVDNYTRQTAPENLLEELRGRLAAQHADALGACLGRQIVLLACLEGEHKPSLAALCAGLKADIEYSPPVQDPADLPAAFRQLVYTAQPTRPERISGAFSCIEKEIAVKIATGEKSQALQLMEEMLFSYRSMDTALGELQASLQTRCVVIDHYLEITVGSAHLSPAIPFAECGDREGLKKAVRAYIEIRHSDIQDSQAHRVKDIVNQAIVDMEKNYADGFYSLSKAAENLKISSAYLSKIFKDLMGKTFTEYLNDIRIDEAKECLQNSSMDIADIARRCGFNSANYFCRVYKKITGTSASDYRSRLTGPGP